MILMVARWKCAAFFYNAYVTIKYIMMKVCVGMLNNAYENAYIPPPKKNWIIWT